MKVSNDAILPGCFIGLFQVDYDDSYCAISDGISECGLRLHEINKKVFIPFQINDSPSTPLFEIDPDMQYYLDMNYTENIRCNYHFEDVFDEKMKEVDKNSLSMFHLNVKSLPKHFDELEFYLNSLDVKCSFLGLTETWLTECKQEYYDLLHYSCINKFRNDSKGAGVTLKIREGLPYFRISYPEQFDSELESIFIEVDKTIFNTVSNVVIAVFYRMPDSSVEFFNERINDIMNVIKKENKLIGVMGDLNIDF